MSDDSGGVVGRSLMILGYLQDRRQKWVRAQQRWCKGTWHARGSGSQLEQLNLVMWTSELAQSYDNDDDGTSRSESLW